MRIVFVPADSLYTSAPEPLIVLSLANTSVSDVYPISRSSEFGVGAETFFTVSPGRAVKSLRIVATSKTFPPFIMSVFPDTSARLAM